MSGSGSKREIAYSPLTNKMSKIASFNHTNIGLSDTSVGLTVEHVMSEINKWDPNDNVMFSGHTGAVWAVTSTSDNSHIFSGSEDKTIIVWDGLTNSELNKLEGHTGTINVLDITSDNQFLISGCWNGLLMIWDWRAGIKSGDLIGHTAGIYCSKMLKDGDTLLTGSGDHSAKMWSIKSRYLIRSFNCEGNSVFGLAVLTNQTALVCGGWGGVLRVWENIQSDVKTKDINPNAGVIQSITSSPNSSYLVVGTRNNIIIVYNYPAFTEKIRHLVHNNWVRNLVSTSDSKYFLSASADKSVRLFNFESNLECFAFDRDDGYVFGLHLSVDGTILYTGASDKILRKRIVGVKDNINVLTGHEKCIMSLSVSSDSRFVVTGSEDNTIRIWNIQTMSETAVLRGHTSTIWGINLTKNMKYILSASGDKTVRMWDFNDHHEVNCFTSHSNPIFTVASSGNSKFAASGAQDKLICLYDLDSKTCIHKFEGHTDTVFSVKFTEDGEVLCSGAADYTIRIWSVSRKVQIEKLDTKGGMVESIAITKDSKYLIIGDRGCLVHLWDFENRKKIKAFTMHNKWVKSVCLSYDDSIIASASNDMMIYTYSLKEKKVINSFAGHTSTIRAVGISDDFKYLVSAGEDKSVKVWALNDSNIMKVNQYGSQLDSFLFLNCVYSENKAAGTYLSQSISPLRLTLCHVYCYEGSHQLLKEALDSSAMLKKDTLNNSPLFYALERNSQNCIDTILVYLNELSQNEFNNFLENCWTLRDDFEKLLKNRSIHLPEFLEHIFYITQQPGLAKFGVPLHKLPVIDYKVDLNINVNDFLKSGIMIKSEELLIEFRVLPFPIPLISGSRASIQMLKNIADCPNRLISRASVILIIVRSRWSNFWYFILLLTFVYWANLGVMIWLLVEDTTDSSALAIYIVLNFVLLFYELIQMFSAGIREYISFWNLVDLARVGICISWIIISVYVGEEHVYYLSYVMVIFNFVRGLSGFRAFDSTRFYVRLIVRALLDTIPFIVIFLYTTLFFGTLNWSSDDKYRTDKFVQLWKTPYELSMGNFVNSEKLDLNFGYFMLTSLLNVIIILNLLISILGDSYDRFQAEAIEIGNLEMVELILEIETLMFWRRNYNERKYIQVCDATRFEGITDEWEGKLKAIEDVVKRNGKQTRTYFEMIKKKLDAIELKLK